MSREWKLRKFFRAFCPACLEKFVQSIRRIGERSLVSRLLALLMMGAVVVYLIVNVGLWWTASNLIEDNLESQAVRWLSELDELGTPLYASQGGRHLSNIDKRIKHFPEIAFIRYYDVTGTKVLGEYGPGRGAEISPLKPDQIAQLSKTDGAERNYLIDRSILDGAYLRFISPVRVRSIRSDGLLNFSLESERPENVKIIGYIDLSIDSGYYKQQLIRSIASGSLLIAVLMAVGLFFGSRIIRKALAPLTALQEPLARLARGETDVNVERAKDAEVAVISDALNTTIKAIKERDAALRKMAERDPLTDLVNRGVFRRELEKEIEHAAHDAVSSAMFFIDLDQFKYINDTLGHPAGDKLLVRVAELLKSRVRDKDVVSRFGGDEFTVLARNVSREDAMEMGRSFNQIMRDMRLVESDKVLSVNCSIGIAMIEPGQRYSAEEVMAHADMACFDAKSHGRNRMHLYEEDGAGKNEMAMDIGWFQHIKQIIEQNRFRLMYQPIVDVLHSDKEGYEVLLRMPGPSGELVLPSVFLPVAQRFGLMAEIDRWVIVHALKALAEFRASGRDIIFSINLSGQALEDVSLLQLVKDHLARNRLPPDRVIFEITEQSAMRHLDKAQSLIKGLMEIGCRFALDDFGTGFSSFSYLQQLPVDFIKIDGSFVRNMTSNSMDQTMVNSIVQIARSLGKRTVAEFVQDEKTRTMLKDSGVDYVQGNYIGVPAEKLPVPLRVVASAKKNVG